MKRNILTFALCLLCVLAFAWLQPKTYKVELPLDQWNVVIQSIDSKQVSALLESQLVPQLKAEQAKADSLNKKKP